MMKIEYFADGCADCPILLIYGEEPTRVHTLCVSLDRLIDGLIETITIHELPGYVSVNGCQLVAKRGHTDVGVEQIGEDVMFECRLQQETWREVRDLLEPFTWSYQDDRTHFQYVNETSDISLMISTQRAW